MRLLPLLASTLLVGCASLPSSSFQNGIVGTWSTGDGTFEKTYFANGNACGWFYADLDNHDPNYRYTFKSTWKIQGNQLTSTVVASDDPDLLPGATFTDVIDSMSANEYSFHGLDSTDPETRIRVPIGKEKHPCSS